MEARRLAVEGAWEFTPTVFPDDRGTFVSPFQDAAIRDALGHSLFPVVQSSTSVSRRGVVRGVHYTRTPPGSAKYVHCSRGRVRDFVVDLRVGSPGFGTVDVVELDGDTYRGVYFPAGVGHAFAALTDDAVVSYLLSQEYVPANELAVSVLDPDLALPLPEGPREMSARDIDAPGLREAREAGLLPDYDECARIEAGWRTAPASMHPSSP